MSLFEIVGIIVIGYLVITWILGIFGITIYMRTLTNGCRHTGNHPCKGWCPIWKQYTRRQWIKLFFVYWIIAPIVVTQTIEQQIEKKLQKRRSRKIQEKKDKQ